ncbi:ATP-binding protein [Methanobrevibacter curvatus]|uniref:Putative AAA-ATPase n=1 Tax=Methanobrevibacter curvatus TaxID=49547 RepID=A0A165Z5S7_9EURY|nr:AAA family ATPase [Methanobrevibacter curvatus]KZX10283.1 putative AAA-ATPase [Methanobrevibacter curvatus]
MIEKDELSLGIATLNDIIENNKIYVDKTEIIEKFIGLKRKYYFLSRPRRFGKSLLVNTLKELFEANKELFKGLYIYDKWDWTISYPVIHLDLSKLKSNNKETLEISLNFYLDRIAKNFNITLQGSYSNDKFTELIEEVSKSFGKNVVVLIDEYDKPIINNISDKKLSEDIRDGLKDFYAALKGADSKLEFVFITGVTKFTKVSIFSDLNNLVDLTMDPICSKICGYTHTELEKNFKNNIINSGKNYNLLENQLIDYIKDWYDGYSWDGENFLYNPFSILSFFHYNTFNTYWFETGTPSFLMDIIKLDNNVNLLFNNNLTLSGTYPSFDINNFDLKTILLQSGYLTIKDKKLSPGELPIYNLDFPNKEVKESFFTYVLGNYTNKSSEDIYFLSKSMFNQLINLNEDGFQQSLEILFSNINYSLHSRLNDLESFYHILFLSWMKIIGFDIQGEIIQLKGRLDAVLVKENIAIILELKFSKTKSMDKLLDEAINQIINKDYYKPYQDKKLILVGITIKNKEVKCRIEKYGS